MMFLLILYMQIESSNNSKDDAFPQTLKNEKENIICKDGFCTLPNQNQNQNIIIVLFLLIYKIYIMNRGK